MKKGILYLGLAIVVFHLAACSEGILDVEPSNQLIEDRFWEGEEHALSAINGVYVSLRNHVDRVWLDVISPNSFNENALQLLATGRHDPGNQDIFQEEWEDNYEGIGRANNVLANIDQIDMDEDLKRRIEGEARFLRAFFYQNLVRLYGGVPLITDRPNAEEHGDLPRDPKTEVMEQVFEDLDYAIEVLPVSYDQSDIGRATKGAAMGLKARYLLYEERWEEAAEYAEEVMGLGVYELFPDYRGLFMPGNENNQEVIFDIQFSEPDITHPMNLWLELQYDVAPTVDLVDSYLMIDGQTTEESSMYDPENPYENRDPRLEQTIVAPGTMFRGRVVPDDKQFNTGYGYKKNTTYEDDVLQEVNRESGLNFIILRYADILLMYAEAKNEVSGPDGSIYNALNEIRSRAGMANVQEGLTQDELREVIRHERRIELAGEGLYYNDIRRWRIAEDVMNTTVYDIDGEFLQDRNFDPNRDYLWPIHSNVIEDNPSLDQNPGY